MAIAITLFSLSIVLLSVYGVFQPASLISLVRRFMAGGSGLWVAVVVRLIFAVLLWFSAPLSLTPTTFRILAVLVLVSAFALPVMGDQRILKLMEWVGNWRPSMIRLWCLIGVAFGGFLLWSISPVFAAV
jgi:hypothetical protein